MREIKFRALIKKPSMVIHPDGRETRIDYGVEEIDFVEKTYCTSKSGGWIPYELLMQYTGLKDKHGKEIYEGDIFDLGGGWINVVTWKEERAGFGLYCPSKKKWDTYSLDSCFKYNLGVLGNIYEDKNPLEREQ